MTNRNDAPTEEEATTDEQKATPITRRRLVQLAAVGAAGTAGAALTGTGTAQSSPDRLEILAAGSDPVEYSFTATGSVTPIHSGSFVSAESDEESITENDDGTVTASGRVKSRYGDAFDVTGDVVGLLPENGDYRLYLNGEEIARSDLVVQRTRRLEITTPDDGSVEYSLTTSGEITKVRNVGNLSAEDNDTIVQNDDGTWTVTGLTGNGYGDTFDFAGEVLDFAPTSGSFGLVLDGDSVTPHELTGEKRLYDRQHSYSFVGAGDDWADVYIEVEDGGNMVASTIDGATVDPDYYWINEDGTKAAARVFPDDRDAFQFDTGILDVTVDGTADAYVNGSESSLDWYPRPGATGDAWKGGFPWQDQETTGDERLYDRKHSYSFEGVGDDWADVYIEVEDGGNMVASTLEGATVDPDYLWISEDGTKAAARVFPDDRDAFQFDTGILDVTVEGTADAYVNGSESSLDWYPRPGATGDDWKGGFSWQDEETTNATTEDTSGDTSGGTSSDGIAMGGGSGYGGIITSGDADYVVHTASGVQNALSAASSGDIVFVAGDAVIDTGSRSIDVPAGVTLASNRGQNGAAGALLHTNETPQIMLRPQANARVTGLRLRGHSPGQTVTWQDGISFSTPTYAMRLEGTDVEVDNCEVWGWPDRAIAVQSAGAHVHHNYIYDNNGQGLGYGVAAADECLIEYNYFHNNRHSVTCAYNAPGYTARYNHFSSTSVMHICDVHDPFQGDTTITDNVIENGESRTWDNPAAEGVAGYPGGFNGGSLTITDNWFFDQGSAYLEGFGAVSDGGNVYGGESSHDPADVIPNHPGLADRPWL